MSKSNNDLNFDKLLSVLKQYINDENELELVTKAYRFAFEKHFGVKRLTGEDYIEHPLNVANILTTIKADAATICAALLHDVMEDCGVSREEMTDKFGEEIAHLVGPIS